MKGTRTRRILMILILLVLVLFAARAALDMWAGHQLDTAITRLEKQHGSLDARTLNPPHVPEGENRARAIRAAAALINYAPLKSWSELQHSYTLFLKQPRPAVMPANLRTFVETNRSTFRLVDDARSRAQSSWEADYPNQSNIPRLLEIRTLSNGVYLAARLALEAGRPDEATGAIASGMAMSASLRQEPYLIAQLIRIHVGLQHVEAVQRLLTESEPSTASLNDLAKWLSESRTPDPMHLGLIGELKLFNDAFARGENSSEQASLPTGGVLPGPWLHLTSGGPLAGLARPFSRLARLRYLEQMEHLIEMQAGPRPRPSSAPPPPRWAVFRRFAHIAVPGLERAMDTGDLFNSELGLTELAVALRRYRIEHGQYPDTLSALVPTYVPKVPIDPFTGKAPVYTRQGAGFRLRGENGSQSVGLIAAPLDWTVPK
jgi:hypothetical protein